MLMQLHAVGVNCYYQRVTY